MTANLKLKKVEGFIPDCPEYNVFSDGVQIGKVYRGWWRLGGTAWSHSERPTFHSGFTSRQKAVEDLVRKVSAQAVD